MAYEVTATRRRPQQFENLVGQEFVAETLKNAIKTEKFAHAYLFTGPRGCGKTSTARILSKAFNCQRYDKPTTTPCGECESCRAITNSSSIDVIEIDGASNRSINDIRQIKDEIMFPPNASRYKIYIIDEVHMLSTEAFNALLKTIEEPPSYVIFIFATTELQAVPVTIKSRCQQYNFRLVSVERLKNLLADACKEMEIQSDEEALYWIAKQSGGSVRDTYTLFDQIVAFSDGFITYEKIRDKLGLIGIESLNEIFEYCVQENTLEVMTQIDNILQSGISIEQFISNSAEYLRSILLIKNGITKEALLGQSSERYSKMVISKWNTIQTERAISIFLQLHRDIRYSISPRYELELAFSKLCWLTQYVSPSEVKAAIDKAHSLLERGADTKPKVEQNTNEERLSNASPVSNKSEKKQMPHFSFFDNKPNEDASLPDETQNGEATPFSNGGALPPENTEAATKKDIPVFFSSLMKQEDEKQIETSQKNSTISSEDFFNENENNLETEDDINQNEPVNDEENYASTTDDEYYEHIANEYENNNNDTTQATHTNNKSSSNSKFLGNTITAPDGFSISIEKLYGSMVAELSISNAMISSVLMQATQWEATEDSITVTIPTSYQKSFLEQNIELLQTLAENITHKKMKFNTKLVTEQKTEIKKTLPLQVEIVQSVFKGTVL